MAAISSDVVGVTAKIMCFSSTKCPWAPVSNTFSFQLMEKM